MVIASTSESESLAPVDPHQPSFQVHRLHRDPDAPRGNPGRLGHPGDALLAAAHHADDVHEVSSSNPLQITHSKDYLFIHLKKVLAGLEVFQLA